MKSKFYKNCWRYIHDKQYVPFYISVYRIQFLSNTPTGVLLVPEGIIRSLVSASHWHSLLYLCMKFNELLTLLEHLNSSPVFSVVRVTWYLVFCVMLSRSLFVLGFFFSWPMCICPSSNYGFWLPLWYFQTFLKIIRLRWIFLPEVGFPF
jgi:hypothetical protein